MYIEGYTYFLYVINEKKKNRIFHSCVRFIQWVIALHQIKSNEMLIVLIIKRKKK